MNDHQHSCSLCEVLHNVRALVEITRSLEARIQRLTPNFEDSGGTPKNTGIQKEFYSLKEAAAVMGVSPQTIRRLLKRGLLHSSNALRTKQIHHSEFERYRRETS